MKRMTIPLFEPVTAPLIESIAHEELVKWQAEWEKYEKKLRMRCRTTGEDVEQELKTLEEVFDSNLLSYCCEHKWKIPRDEITEEDIRREIDKILNTMKNDTLPIMKDIMGKLQMDLKERDVEQRVAKYFVQFEKIVKEHGIQSYFQGEKKSPEIKAKCKWLVKRLTPSSLKERVEEALDMSHRTAKENHHELHDLILEKALEQEKEHQSIRFRQDKMKRKLTQDDRHSGKTKKQKYKPTSDAEGEDNATAAATFIRRLQNAACWGCNTAGHRLANCTTVTDEQARKDIVKRVLKNKKKKQA